MITKEDNIKLEQLKILIDDYSYPEKRYPGIVNKIDELLLWAITSFISQGNSLQTIKNIIGEPFAIIGDDEKGKIEWLYPCLEIPDMQPQRTTNWYFNFIFQKSVLQSYEKKCQLMIL